MSDLFSTGAFVNGAHHYHLKVYYADTDAGAVVYHANYLAFAERARFEMLRLLGLNLADYTKETGCYFTIRKLNIEYLRPAQLSEEVKIVTSVGKIGGASLEMFQEFWRNDEKITEISLKLVYVHGDKGSLRIPQELRDMLADYMKKTD